MLAVNYRGSSGFGKNFMNAATMEFAGKMHDDLIDAVNWAVKENVTTRDKVAIYGGSYGGYATLTGLTFTPDVFACGVDIVGPSNLISEGFLAKCLGGRQEPIGSDFVGSSLKVLEGADFVPGLKEAAPGS